MDVRGVFSFLVILKEAFKCIPKNGKLLGLVALLSFLLSVITYVAFDFSLLGLAQDTVSLAKSFLTRSSSFNASDPSWFTPSLSTPSRLQDEYDHMRQIIAITFAVEIAFPFILLIIFFFTTIATILIAAVSTTGNTLSIKDLFSRVAGTWTKPFLTSIYVSIHSLGFFPILVIFAVPVFLYPNIVTAIISIFLAIVVFLFYLYLVAIWALAIVVSVVEEGCYGMVAMGKASELAKGQRLNGYMLSLFFFLLNLIIALVYLKIPGNTIPSSSLVYVLLLEILATLVSIYQMVAYTVLYFHCKKQHGEEAEIDIGVNKYTLLPTTYPVH
ncbi:uncharacterized protein [Primulina eburnea]|uniref:uncharacterized protein n=1 Tax=Primulina eburnea TaxID=1245227 RepID=UPI003C6C220F